MIPVVLKLLKRAKPQIAQASLKMPYAGSLKEGSKHNLAWTRCVLNAIYGYDVTCQAMKEHKALYGKGDQEGPQFDGQETMALYNRTCAEFDAKSAWPSCVLALEPEDEDKCKHNPLRMVQDIMRGFIELRDRAKALGDHMRVKGFKGAANTFLGCMKHVFPRVQDRYVSLLKAEMAVACKIVKDDPGLEFVAMVSDSVIYTSAEGEPELTDERIRTVLETVNDACACCKFEPERKYANFAYIKKNMQFGRLAAADDDNDDNDVFQRGIVGRLHTPEAVEHILDLIRHLTTKEMGIGKMDAAAAAMPSPDAALEALEKLPKDKVGNRERSDFGEKRAVMMKIMADLGVCGTGGGGGVVSTNFAKPKVKKKKGKKRKRNEDGGDGCGGDGGDGGGSEGESGNTTAVENGQDDGDDGDGSMDILTQVRNLAKQWGVRLGSWC